MEFRCFTSQQDIQHPVRSKSCTFLGVSPWNNLQNRAKMIEAVTQKTIKILLSQGGNFRLLFQSEVSAIRNVSQWESI